MQAAANNSLIQITYMVSAELDQLTADALDHIRQEPPMVINVLQREFKKMKADTLVSESSFLSILRSSPEKIAGVFSGFGTSVKTWKKILDPE